MQVLTIIHRSNQVNGEEKCNLKLKAHDSALGRLSSVRSVLLPQWRRYAWKAGMFHSFPNPCKQREERAVPRVSARHHVERAFRRHGSAQVNISRKLYRFRFLHVTYREWEKKIIHSCCRSYAKEQLCWSYYKAYHPHLKWSGKK